RLAPPAAGRAHPRRVRRGPAGVLGLHADRRAGGGRRRGRRHAHRGRGRANHLRAPVRAAGGTADRPGARPDEGGGEAGRHGGIQGRRHRPAGRHHRDRGGGGRAQRLADDHRERRAPGPGPVAPAAWAGGARQRGIVLRAAVPAAAVADRAPAPGNHARDQRRVPDRRARPGAAWPRRSAGYPPDRTGRVPPGRPRPRRRPAAARAGTGRRVAGAGPGDRRPAGRALGRRRDPLRRRLRAAWPRAPAVTDCPAPMQDAGDMPDPIPLLIDTAPGVDDALALLMAFNDPAHRVVGLSIVAGNVGLSHTVGNALKLCDVAGQEAVPVFPGCEGPLVHPCEDAADVHGADGFGDTGYVPSERKASTEHAALAILRLSHEHAGRLLLVALGPLTNLALALRLDPTLPQRVARLVVMGGAVTGHGNLTAAAEFNIGYDPEAAKVVFDAFDRIDLADWEATLAHGLHHDRVLEWLDADSPRARFYRDISRRTREWSADRRGEYWHS